MISISEYLNYYENYIQYLSFILSVIQGIIIRLLKKESFFTYIWRIKENFFAELVKRRNKKYVLFVRF